MNTFLLLVIALAVTGTLGVFLGEIFILMIVVALAVFYAALFLFAPAIIDAIADASKNLLIIAIMVGAVLSLVVGLKLDGNGAWWCDPQDYSGFGLKSQTPTPKSAQLATPSQVVSSRIGVEQKGN